MQPIVIAKDGYVRFQENKLVSHLLDWASERGCSLNELARLDGIPRSDWEQFAQLIGYSISGFGELSYVSDAAYDKARARVDKIDKITKKQQPKPVKPAKAAKAKPSKRLAASTARFTKGVVLEATPTRIRMVCQPWEESERGWGTRPDGYTLHRSMEEHAKFIKLYWDAQPSGPAPDEYSRPAGKPYWCEVDKAEVAHGESGKGTMPYHKHGFWGSNGNNCPTRAG